MFIDAQSGPVGFEMAKKTENMRLLLAYLEQMSQTSSSEIFDEFSELKSISQDYRHESNDINKNKKIELLELNTTMLANQSK